VASVTLMFLEAHNLLKQERPDTVLGRIKTCTHIGDAVRHADYVQESVPIVMKSKTSF
jgi:3-hydroxyacyl-CoA dehydrogenase